MAFQVQRQIGFTTGIPWVQFSDTIPLPINTVTIVGEGMAPYMLGYGVIPKNITRGSHVSIRATSIHEMN